MQDSIIEGYAPAALADSARPMTFAEYAAWARTKRRPGTKTEDLLNSALGLAGELGEIGGMIPADAAMGILPTDSESLDVSYPHFIEEVGDYLFYVAWVLDAWGCSGELALKGGLLHPLDDVGRLFANVAFKTGIVADAVKKAVFHGRPARDPDFIALMMQDAVDSMSLILDLHRITFAEVMSVNVRKLDARYPSGFVGGGGIRD